MTSRHKLLIHRPALATLVHDKTLTGRRSACWGAVLLFLLTPLLHAATPSLPDDPIFKALNDELARSMSSLKLEHYSAPYFGAYHYRRASYIDIEGTLGSITSSKRGDYAATKAELRVGDYSSDNTHFIPQDYWSFKSGAYQLPIRRGDYYLLRRALWWITDDAYKQAAELYSRKQAALQKYPVKEHFDDFSREDVYRYSEPEIDAELESAATEQTVSEMSAVFKQFPAILDSLVWFNTEQVRHYFLNSEGSWFVRNEPEGIFMISALGLNAEGKVLQDHDLIVAPSLAQMPARPALVLRALAVAQRLNARLKAPAGEKYIGPVLFTGQAAAEFMLQVLGYRLSALPDMVYEDEKMKQYATKSDAGNSFTGRIGLKIMPSSFQVADDPTINSFNGLPLSGGFPVDDQGVKSQRVTVVKDGKLLTVLNARSPVKKVARSNGHARFAMQEDIFGAASNLLIESKDALSEPKLKKRLLKICKETDLPFAIEVRRVLSAAMKRNYNRNASRLIETAPDQDDKLLQAGLEAYKIFRDGHEELLPGVDFQNVTIRVLRDIVAAGVSREPFNTYLSLPGHSGEAPISVIAPSVLIEEMEVDDIGGATIQPPIASRP